MKKKLSILYSSYGGNNDLLPITYYFYQKYVNFDLKVYWGSNGDVISNFEEIAPKFIYINKIDKDLGWSENLKSYLEEVETEYVLLLLDDFLFIKRPNFDFIKKGFKIMQEKKAVYFRLNDRPPPDTPINDFMGYIKYYSDYRSSLQPAIWNKNILLKICEYKFNPWLFEWKAGIVKETKKEIFLGAYEDLIHIKHYIEKEMWIKHMLDIIKKEGFEISNNREIWEYKMSSCKSYSLKDEILNLLPKVVLFHMRKILKKGIFSDKFTGYSHK
jgi:hypothetical protein